MQNGFGVAVVSCAHEPSIDDPEALLERWHGRRGWADAVAEAGADAIAVVQRFRKDVVLRRGNVAYHFVASDERRTATLWGTRVVGAVRALDPTVVHVDGLVFPALVRHLRLLLPDRTAIVVQDHGGIHANSSLFRSWGRRFFHAAGLRAADGFLFTAREQAVPWQRARIIGRSQTIYEVPESSTDMGQAPHVLRGEARPLPGRPALLWVGRLNANKDPLTVLRGFEATVRSLPEAELTFVYHDQEILSAVRARVADSALLRPRVHLRGAVDRGALAPLYAGADLFVLGSHHEGSGYALLEALSFGVTPVVTDIPSFRALTGGGRVGALFRPGDDQELADALVRLGNTDLAARRLAVRAHFDRELDWSAVGRKALETYRSAAIARNRSSRAR
jgi:glycosyltransferase involved in cell wall biosynthesis